MADELRIDGKEFVEFYKVLGKTQPELKKAIRKNMRSIAKPILADVRRAEMAIPSKNGSNGSSSKEGSLGLRASLVAATKIDFNGTGRGAVLSIRVSKSRFEAVSGRPRSIPWHMEGRLKRKWRHPIFGRRATGADFYDQKPQPYLYVTVAKHQPRLVNAVAEAVDEVLKQIESKTK
jgi:hypothetical protein